MVAQLRWGRPILRADIEAIEARKKAKANDPVILRSIAIKEQRRRKVKSRVRAVKRREAREEGLPKRLLAGLDEAERLQRELGWL